MINFERLCFLLSGCSFRSFPSLLPNLGSTSSIHETSVYRSKPEKRLLSGVKDDVFSVSRWI